MEMDWKYTKKTNVKYSETRTQLQRYLKKREKDPQTIGEEQLTVRFDKSI